MLILYRVLKTSVFPLICYVKLLLLRKQGTYKSHTCELEQDSHKEVEMKPYSALQKLGECFAQYQVKNLARLLVS